MKSFIREIKVALLEVKSDFVLRYSDTLERLEAQNELAAISGFDFVTALQPTAQRISERTGKRYYDILMEAKARLLAGEAMADTLWYFDSQLVFD